jgi:hypothetical protein
MGRCLSPRARAAGTVNLAARCGSPHRFHLVACAAAIRGRHAGGWKRMVTTAAHLVSGTASIFAPGSPALGGDVEPPDHTVDALPGICQCRLAGRPSHPDVERFQ